MGKISDAELLRLVEAAFDSIAEAYLAAEDTEACRTFSGEMLELLGDVSGKHILDAGCGFGQQAEILIQRGARVTGVDISGRLISLAQDRVGRSKFAKFIKADIRAYLKSQRGRFDGIISFFELMFHRDIEGVLRQFARALKKEGSLLVLLPHPVRNMGMHDPPDYFATGLFAEEWRTGRFWKYYKGLGDYVNAVVTCGFHVRRLLEPVPPREKVAFYDVHSCFPRGIRYPQCLVILCQKI